MEETGPERVVEWVVSVDDAHVARVEDVVAALEDAGLKVERVLVTLGIVCGRADEACRDALQHVMGVASVAPAQTIRVDPPDAPIQ
ncbi:hypothetical protein GCM10022377_14780 [Zhihengliuella alba]|uniref:Ketohydroxyglutarate aldolase n=1 Tax=Zhihengliuella alba TaxID=547018 RepID=A0ABP7D820_9MICC